MDNFKKFVINLERRPDRLNIFMSQFPIKDINIIHGFDGLNSNLEIDKDLINRFSNLNMGEIGCFISHLRIYKYIVENNINYSIIFEDDAIFCYNFIVKCNNIIENEFNDQIDILYIGGRFTPNFKMNLNNCTKISDNIVKHDLYKIDQSIDCDRTTHAYIISFKLAKFLLNIFNTETNMITIPIDHWIIQSININFNIYSSYPLLCYSPMIGDSDIR